LVADAHAVVKQTAYAVNGMNPAAALSASQASACLQPDTELVVKAGERCVFAWYVFVCTCVYVSVCVSLIPLNWHQDCLG
jgi:hypothetical protein